MPKIIRSHPIEFGLLIFMIIVCVLLSFGSPRFLTLVNISDLINTSSVNIIFAVGLLVVLIAGGIDISFAVGASVVQYLVATFLLSIGGGNWAIGLLAAASCGIALGCFNAFLVQAAKVSSIVVTIATINVFFGLLMYVSGGVSIYNLPDWLVTQTVLLEHQMSDGNWVEIRLPTLVMLICVFLTYMLLNRINIGRQLYAFGDNAEGAHRLGINVTFMRALSFGWMGLMLGIAGLMQAHYTQEVVPNALYGRELDVLAAVVLGGARLGGGRGSVLGCILGVIFISIIQNGLNLMGVSPFAFKMIIGIILLLAISLSNADLSRLFQVNFFLKRQKIDNESRHHHLSTGQMS